MPHKNATRAVIRWLYKVEDDAITQAAHSTPENFANWARTHLGDKSELSWWTLKNADYAEAYATFKEFTEEGTVYDSQRPNRTGNASVPNGDGMDSGMDREEEEMTPVWLVCTVTAAVMRVDKKWISGEGGTAEKVYRIIKREEEFTDIRKKDRRKGEAAMVWLVSETRTLNESDKELRKLLLKYYNSGGVPDDMIGRIACVVVAYEHSTTYDRKDMWDALAEYSQRVGEPGEPLGDHLEMPIPAKVISRQVNSVPYMTACTCPKPHGPSSKRAGLCETSEKAFRDIVTMSIATDDNQELFEYTPEKGDPNRKKVWPVGANLLIRDAIIKAHKTVVLENTKRKVQCTVLRNVDALIQ